MQWPDLIVPALAGVFSFAGAFAAVRVEIRWIKERLHEHEQDIAQLRARVDHL